MGFSTCWKCGSQFWMPDDLEAVARRDGVTGVYCAHGHRGVFSGKDLTAEARRETERLKQRLAERDDEIKRQCSLREQTERQLSATKGVVTRIKNRVGHGVCPCCSRTFQDLQRHMKSKHSEYAKSDVILQAAE